jgi:hypothetical protein
MHVTFLDPSYIACMLKEHVSKEWLVAYVRSCIASDSLMQAIATMGIYIDGQFYDLQNTLSLIQGGLARLEKLRATLSNAEESRQYAIVRHQVIALLEDFPDEGYAHKSAGNDHQMRSLNHIFPVELDLFQRKYAQEQEAHSYVYSDTFINYEATLEFINRYYHQEELLSIELGNRRYTLPQVLLIDNTTLKVPLDRIIFSHNNTDYKLSASMDALTEEIFRNYKSYQEYYGRKNITNNPALRIRSVNYRQGEIHINTECTNYFAAVRTNFAMDFQLCSCGKSLRDIYNTGKLNSLDRCELGNVTGINILLFTVDNHLVLQKRSAKVLVRPSKLASSGSGTIEPVDIRSSMRDMDILREVEEELGVYSHDTNDDSTIFLGITRDLVRGGLPDLFFVASTSLTKSDFVEKRKRAIDKYETQNLVFWDFSEVLGKDFRTVVDENQLLDVLFNYLNENAEDICVPLYVNVLLWVKYLMDDIKIE